MSIVTKTGDDGSTGLMYNRRVPKYDARIEACGAVDELKAAIGLARALARGEWLRTRLLDLATRLVTVMGELATLERDLSRYVADGFALVTREHTAALESIVQEVEAQKVASTGWATPGANPVAAALEVARTTCRRAERRVCELKAARAMSNAEIIIFLNRLSDVLWLLARWAETHEERGH